MNHYMIELKLPTSLTEEFIALIPKQRSITDKLMSKGIIISYSLALDRSTLWIVVAGSSEEAVLDNLYTLPLTKYMQLHIQKLSFHNSGTFALSNVSLN